MGMRQKAIGRPATEWRVILTTIANAVLTREGLAGAGWKYQLTGTPPTPDDSSECAFLIAGNSNNEKDFENSDLNLIDTTLTNAGVHVEVKRNKVAEESERMKKVNDFLQPFVDVWVMEARNHSDASVLDSKGDTILFWTLLNTITKIK